MTTVTHRFVQAVDYARIAHAGQVRKGTRIPYFTHLLGVATLVIEHGGSEDQAIAGLLHDCIEDCGQAHADAIRAQFGDAVIRIVLACTDGTAEGKASHTDPHARRTDWVRRKHDYLQHLIEADADVLLVSGCDKLHNAMAIVADLDDPEVGIAVFDRFTGGRDGTLGYYESLARVFSAARVPMAQRLDACVARMHAQAGSIERRPLTAGRGA